MVHNKWANIVLVFLILTYVAFVANSVQFFNETKIHRSNREVEDSKRYLIFPQGSNVQMKKAPYKEIHWEYNILRFWSRLKLIYCMTIGTYAKPATFFTIGVTAGLAWELPYANTVPYRKPAEVYHRRSRRELYRKVELMLSTRGKDGKACVHKALCQAGKRKSNHVGKGSFMQEIIHSIFTLPDGSYDADPMTEYEKSYQSSSEDDCEKKYSTCPEIF